MKILWAVVAVVLVGVGYGLGRIGGQEAQHSGTPPKAALVLPKADEASPENVEYITALRAAFDEPMLLVRTANSAELLKQLSDSNV